MGDDTGRAFRAAGYEAVGKKYGVPLFDLKRDKTRRVDTPLRPMDICCRALDADYLINLPVLKGHCQTAMTCALKNCKGCLPDREKRRFHSEGLMRPIAALAAALRYGPPRAELCCDLGQFFFHKGDYPPRPFGMRQPSPGHAPTKPAPLSLRTATGFCPASSCACVTTAWETSPWPGSITAGPETVSRTTRHFFTTSGSSGGSCNALAARREERSILSGPTPPPRAGPFPVPREKTVLRQRRLAILAQMR